MKVQKISTLPCGDKIIGKILLKNRDVRLVRICSFCQNPYQTWAWIGSVIMLCIFGVVQNLIDILFVTILAELYVFPIPIKDGTYLDILVGVLGVTLGIVSKSFEGLFQIALVSVVFTIGCTCKIFLFQLQNLRDNVINMRVPQLP